MPPLAPRHLRPDDDATGAGAHAGKGDLAKRAATCKNGGEDALVHPEEHDRMNDGLSTRGVPRGDRSALLVRCGLVGLLAGCLLTVVGEEPPRPEGTLGAIASGPKPGPNDKVITGAVRRILEREHFLGQPINDDVAQRWFKLFLEALDPMKLFFTQSDVDGFAAKRDALDDLVKTGDISFAYEVLRRFIERVDARLPLIERLIDTAHDFTVPETMVSDRDDARWATSEAEAEDLWRKRIKYDLLVQKMEKTPEAEAKDKLRRRYRAMARRAHQKNADEVLEEYLTTLTSSLDPHTSFMSPGTLENFEISMRLQLDGIGASLRGEDGYTSVAEIVPGGAADRDGRLKAKDRIVGVGQGEQGDFVDVVDMGLNEVVKLIRGKRGTIVRLKVIPVGQTAPKVYDVVRDKIELKDSEARGEIIEHGRKPDGGPYRFGVINLPSFYLDMDAARQGQGDFKTCSRDCRRLLDGFREQGVDAVVLDLRNNGGGSLPEAIAVTGLFIDRGPVVQVKKKDKTVEVYDDTDAGVAWNGPLVVLTNKFSASASEIVAGAIQDYGRGLIIGDRTTHGKGTVQSLLDLARQLFPRFDNVPSYGAIKITMQQFYRPSGESTQLEGVKSDVELPSITTHLPVGESDLDHAIPFDRVPAAAFRGVGRIAGETLQALRANSRQRIAANKEFAKLEQDIARYQRRKDAKTVSLVEAEFEKQWNEGKAAEDEEKKQQEDQDSRRRPVVRRDFWFDESLNVAIDYLTLRNGKPLAGSPGDGVVAKPQPLPR
jgi:carboxyl-terminal processing protease